MDICDDEEALLLMRKSGCQGVLIGFESLDSSVLNKMGKSVNRTAEEYERVVRKLHRHNIEIYATFVMGYDDTEQAFRDVYKFGLDNKLLYLAFNHLVPFPGTPLYLRLEKEGRLLNDKWWLKPGYRFGDVVFRPSAMSADALTDLCLRYRSSFYNPNSILKRLANKVHWSSPLKLQAYAYMNLSARDEAAARRSLLIGGVPQGAGIVHG